MKVFKLTGRVQNYAWGGQHYIANLLQQSNPTNQPFAEYWLGAHDNAPAEVDGGGALNTYIAAAPAEKLGSYVNRAFGRLPYLLKILDVKDMLSIQVHPTKANAVLEFAAENKKGTPLNAPDRNYKDDNHKPELMLALSDFWLLHGFKPEAELKAILAKVPELNFLQSVFAEKGYAGLYRTVMEMDQADVNAALQPLLDRIVPLYKEGKIDKSLEDFWAARAALTYNEPGRIDRGIFSIYFFNVLNLHPGDAIFQDAGQPHAYLEGQNVEIMANSDNVLRGGLTPKHVDVPELLKHIEFEATHAKIIPATKESEAISRYKTPAPDFELSRIVVAAGAPVEITARSVEVYIVLEGTVDVAEGTHSFSRKAGEAFVAFDGAVLSLTGTATVYRASVPGA